MSTAAIAGASMAAVLGVAAVGYAGKNLINTGDDLGDIDELLDYEDMNEDMSEDMNEQ